jgi:hypothetical protein
MATLRGYKTAAAKVRKLARQHDTWMLPTTDEPREKESRTDFGAWLDEESQGWEETDHFQHYYGGEITALAHHVADLNHLEGEAWLDVWLGLKEEFWDEWASKHNAADHWEKNIKVKRRQRK